jgi:hypothetical protein
MEISCQAVGKRKKVGTTALQCRRLMGTLTFDCSEIQFNSHLIISSVIRPHRLITFPRRLRIVLSISLG